MKYFNKLVRDKIPRIISGERREHSIRYLQDNEFKRKLWDKLYEEIEEFVEKPCPEEMADILEVLQEIAKLNDLDWEDVLQAKENKLREKGGFDLKILLEWYK